MNVRRWVFAAVGLLAVVAAVAAFTRPRGVAVQVAPVKRSDLLVPVQCDGTLEPPPGGELRAAEAATVAELFVRDGDRVEASAPLLRLESPELSQKALDARSEALRLEAERASANAELQDLERDERHRREVFEADARLLSSGAITRASAESDERSWREAEGAVRAARARVAALEGNASRLALAERSAAELERRAAALTVRAPLSGTVYGLPRRAGEAVAAGQVVANVIDPGDRRLRARVDQPDLPQIAVGQRLVVSFDGLPRDRWEGKVTFVAPGLRDSGGREVGEVLGALADPEGKLPANAAVEVQIVTGEKAGALVVPRAAVLRDGEKRYVYLLGDGRAHRREVEVGLLGLNDAEVLGGLKENETVILPGSVPLSEGLRVRRAGA
jgi:HlyD family secretion protein